MIDREKAQIGVLISFNEPTAPMRQEVASAGFYDSPWGNHPRIQLLAPVAGPGIHVAYASRAGTYRS